MQDTLWNRIKQMWCKVVGHTPTMEANWFHGDDLLSICSVCKASYIVENNQAIRKK